LTFAARHPGLVDRIVLVATPIPEDPGVELSAITARTLLLFDARDPSTGFGHGSWWQKRIPRARLEMNPDGGPDLLATMWSRVLSHLAPRCKR
jgi:pimeloyl-ACP methyl ester carboxylesterase